jgi:hypothetical protein
MKKLLILFVLTFSFFTSSGQKVKEEAPPLKERIFFGGSFGLQLGTITNINLSPIVGLWVLPRLAVAVGPYYTFYKDPQGKTDIYGGKAYVQFVVLQDLNKFIPLGSNTGLFLHLEDECLSLNSNYWKNVVIPPDRFVMNTLLGGVGLSQQIGRKASLNLMVLWSLLETDAEMGSRIYSNPEIRIAFTF